MNKIKKFFKQLFCKHERGLLIIEGRCFGNNAKYSNGCLKCNKLFGEAFMSRASIVKNSPELAIFSFSKIQNPDNFNNQ
jgi:hypothetical protein